MKLIDQMEHDGRWLFRWRSYLPLVTIVIFVIGCLRYRQPGGSEQFENWWELGCVLIALSGLAMRIAIVGFAPRGTSGRNTTAQKADALNITGLYSIMRHPLYVANFLIWLSALVFLYNWKLLIIGCLIYWLYYERIMVCEEAFLKEKFGSAFENWAAVTPAVIPRLSRWRPPEMIFSCRSALRREYSTLLAIGAALTALEISTDWLEASHFVLPSGFVIFLLVSVIIYTVLRTIKKQTGWLDVVGR